MAERSRAEEQPAPGDRAARLLTRWLPAGTAVCAVVVMLLLVGTPPLAILRYAGYLCWTALPGLLLYRVIRRVPHSLVDDLVMGTILGFGAELIAYVGFAALRIPEWLPVWPLAVIVPFLAVPRLRRHWRRPDGYRAPSTIWSWAVAGIVVFFAACLVGASMVIVPIEPAGGAGSWYVVDQLYLLGLVGDLKHHFPPNVPQIAGERLDYHWFAYAHDAAGSLVSGVDTPVVFLRLGMTVNALLGVVAIALAGWRIFNRGSAGVIAAILVYVAGEIAINPPFSPFGQTMILAWTGPSIYYAWVFTAALVVIVADRLTGGLPTAPIGRGSWLLMPVLGVLVIGGKSTSLPPFLAGIGLVLVVELIRHRRLRLPVFGIACAMGAAYEFGTVFLFHHERHGLRIDPLFALRAMTGYATTHHGLKHYLPYVAALGLYLVYQLLRFSGIAVLGLLALRRTGVRWGPVEWLLLGAFGSAAGLTLLLAHPTDSELHSICSGLPFGGLLAGAGVTALLSRRRVSRRTAVVIFSACAVAAAAVTFTLWWPIARVGLPVEYTIPRFLRPLVMGRLQYWGMYQTLPVVNLAVALALAGAVAAGVWWLARRRLSRLRGLGVVVVLAALTMAGSPENVQAAYFGAVTLDHWHLWQERVTRDQYEAARWLREHSARDDILATNRHVYRGQVALTFWLNAYTERRTLVGSWGYAPRMVDLADRAHGHPAFTPFWDPALLAANDAAIYQPTRERIDRLRDLGVRWLVVDHDSGQESPDLVDFATLRHRSGSIVIYQLP